MTALNKDSGFLKSLEGEQVIKTVGTKEYCEQTLAALLEVAIAKGQLTVVMEDK
jgi:hypothetical protein